MHAYRERECSKSYEIVLSITFPIYLMRKPNAIVTNNSSNNKNRCEAKKVNSNILCRLFKRNRNRNLKTYASDYNAHYHVFYCSCLRYCFMPEFFGKSHRIVKVYVC